MLWLDCHKDGGIGQVLRLWREWEAQGWPVAKHEVEEASEAGKNKATQHSRGILGIILISRTLSIYCDWHVLGSRRELWVWSCLPFEKYIWLQHGPWKREIKKGRREGCLKEGNGCAKIQEGNSCELEGTWVRSWSDIKRADTKMAGLVASVTTLSLLGGQSLLGCSTPGFSDSKKTVDSRFGKVLWTVHVFYRTGSHLAFHW